MTRARRKGSGGWSLGAALGAAAVLVVNLGARARPGVDEAEGTREADVLVRTIDVLEVRYAADPLNPVVGAKLAESHLAMFRLDSRLEHLDRAERVAAELAPRALRVAPARARLSATRLARHDFRGALESSEQAVAADSSDEGALAALYDAALAAGRYARAEWALVRLEREHAGSFAQRVRSARWLDAMGEAGAAFDMLFPACERLEGRAVRREVVAWCQVALGDVERGRSPRRAAGWYRRALELQPGYAAAIEGLADMAYAREEWQRARGLYARIVTDAHPDLQLRLAEIARALGEETEARRHERAFLDLATAPGAEALNAHALAVFYAARPETRDAALAVITRDLADRPSRESFEVAAWIRLRRGELDEALAASDAARRWGRPDASSDYVRGRILQASGRNREAAGLFESATADRAQLDFHLLAEVRGAG